MLDVAGGHEPRATEQRPGLHPGVGGHGEPWTVPVDKVRAHKERGWPGLGWWPA